jgi:hypothetical protein
MLKEFEIAGSGPGTCRRAAYEDWVKAAVVISRVQVLTEIFI